MQEEWRDIPWYEERYSVSSLWRVCCKPWLKWAVFQKWKMLKLRTDNYWYFEAKLCKNKYVKIYRVNRLVWFTFMWWDLDYFNPKEKTIVCHKNHIRKDNRLENLCIWTQRENMQMSVKDWRINWWKEDADLLKDRILMQLIYKTWKYYKSEISERFGYHKTYLWKLQKWLL